MKEHDSHDEVLVLVGVGESLISRETVFSEVKSAFPLNVSFDRDKEIRDKSDNNRDQSYYRHASSESLP